MEYSFSSKEKDSGYVSSDGGARHSTSEDPFNNGLNFDMYAGWCSPSITDQLFTPGAFSPFQSMPSNYATFDPLNFSEQNSNAFAGPECDIVGSPYNGGDKMAFPQLNTPIGFPMESTSWNESSNKKGNSSFNHNLSDTGNCLIPRPLATKTLADKMLRALSVFKESSAGGILAQVWVPMKNGDQYILSTCDQPYLLDQVLAGYREVSRAFTFSAEVKPGSFPGLPGRVFMSQFPEWTSNVVYYNPAEYLRVQHAVYHEVRGSMALPVFEDDPVATSCCAVLELVTVKEKPNFNFEMDNVCRALQAVNLRSTATPRLRSQGLSKNQRSALAEISDVLQAVCHAHRLPLALTWIPFCYNEGVGDGIVVRVKGGNASLNEKPILCIEDTACYVNDGEMLGFVHACSEYHLGEGQGIAGKALQSNHPFFFPDVKGYDISEYPLVHHARKFGLNAAVAIRLRSTYTGDDDYILEFFLPLNIKGSMEQQLLLNNLSGTMQKMCKTLRTVTDAELFGAKSSEVEFQKGSHPNFPSPVEFSSRQTLDNDTSNIEPVPQGVSDPKNIRRESDASREQMNGSRSSSEKKRSTAEKHVSLSVLQHYFSGSLKDAAKSIGVCPTTLKRICRQHGISRWPSRKINKVNRSLRKIQTVLDSVQGVDGGLKFDPTTGGLVAAGSILQDFDARGSILFPTSSPPIRKHKSVASSVSQPSSIDSDNSKVKLEKEENHIDRNNQVELQRRSLFAPNAEIPLTDPCDDSRSIAYVPSSENASLDSYSQFENLGAQNRSALNVENSDSRFVYDELDIGMKDESDVEANDRVIGPNQTGNTSSGMTDSSNTSSSSLNVSSSSSPSFSEGKSTKVLTSSCDSGSKITVKATYKEDTVRFKFEPSLGCNQLYEEVAKRFKLQMMTFQLKYLDDEEEWVLLVSDSDLQECVEILNFSGTRNVKFLVRDAPCAMGSSGSSNCFLAPSS